MFDAHQRVRNRGQNTEVKKKMELTETQSLWREDEREERGRERSRENWRDFISHFLSTRLTRTHQL